MAKSLCKLRKHLLEDDFEKYVQLVSAPQFVCTHCGRAANESRNLCEPRPIAPAKSAGKSKSTKKSIFLRLAEEC